MSTSPALPRLRRTVELLCHLIRVVARDTALWSDDVWVVDSTAIRATSGAVATPCLHLARPPVTFALTGAKADERQVLLELLVVEPQLVATRPGQVLIADKHYYGREFEQRVGELGVRRLRPVRQAKPSGLARSCSSRCGSSSSRSTRSSRASWTWNATAAAPASAWHSGCCSILALTAVIWHNDKTGQPTLRSLVAYGH